MLYFAGEIYEIPQQLFDDNPTCFEVVKVDQDPQVMTTADITEGTKVVKSKDVKKK